MIVTFASAVTFDYYSAAWLMSVAGVAATVTAASEYYWPYQSHSDYTATRRFLANNVVVFLYKRRKDFGNIASHFTEEKNFDTLDSIYTSLTYKTPAAYRLIAGSTRTATERRTKNTNAMFAKQIHLRIDNEISIQPQRQGDLHGKHGGRGSSPEAKHSAIGKHSMNVSTYGAVSPQESEANDQQPGVAL
ncbi:hypothetical protein WN51_03480 [Melipona quadrifasciata]|uniref:Uncharacterized protein n=1 Tax=Melipona quadrifasciata TaxID=166423 RepID=A0A0M8ZW42_9HYME|nr:hypothetical protein WN51_03480 [Melipona quadrifasciata]